MSGEAARAIEEQTDLMKLDLIIIVQRMKIKELRVRAETLLARAGLENLKLQRMQSQRTIEGE